MRGHNAVTLADARDKARPLRDEVRDKKDPLDEREAAATRAKAAAAQAAAGAVTFRTAAKAYIQAHEAGRRHDRHRRQWRQSLDDYVLPVIGDLPVGAIETGHITRILEPIWTEKNETATRVRGRIELVLDYSKVHGWRTGENPARWRGHLQNVLPRPAKVRRGGHFAAIDWQSMGAFMEKLRSDGSMSALALEFAILTACRTNEVLGARRDEIDTKAHVWTIPEGTRTKNHNELRVPLSTAAAEVIEKARRLSGDGDYIFAGERAHKLGEKAMFLLLNGIAADATVHGTSRATFKTWAAETGRPADVTEAALNHTQGKLNEAYQRGDLLERRRVLMQAWSDFCSKPRPADGDNVVELRSSAA